MGLFDKIFGSKKDKLAKTPLTIAEDLLENIFELSELDLSFECTAKGEELKIEIFGDDEELLRAKDGQLLDAFQLFVKRSVQHQLPDQKVNVVVDNDGFREESCKSLINLAEKLKGIVLEKGKPVYFRALPPRDRKIIHQFLAEDGRVKSRSVGDGLYKKIKIYTSNGKSSKDVTTEQADANA